MKPAATYKVVRFYLEGKRRRRTLRRGLTLEEAQAHCNDAETSYKTARSAAAQRRTRERGPWFDGYYEE